MERMDVLQLSTQPHELPVEKLLSTKALLEDDRMYHCDVVKFCTTSGIPHMVYPGSDLLATSNTRQQTQTWIYGQLIDRFSHMLNSIDQISCSAELIRNWSSSTEEPHDEKISMAELHRSTAAKELLQVRLKDKMQTLTSRKQQLLDGEVASTRGGRAIRSLPPVKSHQAGKGAPGDRRPTCVHVSDRVCGGVCILVVSVTGSCSTDCSISQEAP